MLLVGGDSNVDQELRVLKTLRKNLRTYIPQKSRERNVMLCPIYQLPLEVLVRMFHFALPSLEEPHGPVLQALRRVSHQWKQTIDGTRWLWRHVHEKDGILHLKQVLRKSQGASFDVYWDSSEEDDASFKGFFDTVGIESVRWRSAHLTLKQDQLGSLRAVLDSQGAPLLENLTLLECRPVPTNPVPFDLLNGVLLPRLEALSISGLSVDLSIPVLSSLRSIHLNCFKSQAEPLLGFIQSSPRLQHLFLEYVCLESVPSVYDFTDDESGDDDSADSEADSASDDDSSFPEPHLPEFQTPDPVIMNSEALKISLPELTYFSILTNDPYFGPCILGSIDAPNCVFQLELTNMSTFEQATYHLPQLSQLWNAVKEESWGICVTVNGTGHCRVECEGTSRVGFNFKEETLADQALWECVSGMIGIVELAQPTSVTLLFEEYDFAAGCGGLQALPTSLRSIQQVSEIIIDHYCSNTRLLLATLAVPSIEPGGIVCNVWPRLKKLRINISELTLLPRLLDTVKIRAVVDDIQIGNGFLRRNGIQEVYFGERLSETPFTEAFIKSNVKVIADGSGSALQAVDREIRVLKELSKKLDTYVPQKARERNVILCPIYRLPLELLVRIFHLTLPPVEEPHGPVLQSLRRVSRGWRETVDRTRWLWQQAHGTDGILHLEQVMRNSQGAVLDVYWSCGQDAGTDFGDFIYIVGNETYRWRSATLSLEVAQLKAVQDALDREGASQLEELTLSQCKASPTTSEPSQLLGNLDLPRLRTLSISNLPVELSYLVASALQRLHLRSIRTVPMDFLSLLQELPVLQELSLEHVYLDPLTSIEEDDSSVLLEKLAQLHILTDSTLIASWILAKVDIPSCNNFQLDMNLERSFTRLASFSHPRLSQFRKAVRAGTWGISVTMKGSGAYMIAYEGTLHVSLNFEPQPRLPVRTLWDIFHRLNEVVPWESSLPITLLFEQYDFSLPSFQVLLQSIRKIDQVKEIIVNRHCSKLELLLASLAVAEIQPGGITCNIWPSLDKLRLNAPKDTLMPRLIDTLKIRKNLRHVRVSNGLPAYNDIKDIYFGERLSKAPSIDMETFQRLQSMKYILPDGSVYWYGKLVHSFDIAR
ncbi:hypothetical protein FRB90_008131 [Tulasnella sp. 427]|nr:hypothetical protein FRB90_008131 [Tulasnella sp. 427]